MDRYNVLLLFWDQIKIANGTSVTWNGSCIGSLEESFIDVQVPLVNKDMVKVRHMRGAFAAGSVDEIVVSSGAGTCVQEQHVEGVKRLSQEEGPEQIVGKIVDFPIPHDSKSQLLLDICRSPLLSRLASDCDSVRTLKHAFPSPPSPETRIVPKAHMKCSCDVSKQSVDTWWAQAADTHGHRVGC